jgi:cell volume regulation protein A
MLGLVARQLSLGAALGLLVGWISIESFRRARLTTQGLYPVASIAAAGLAFGAADQLGGSGFLAVYIVGLMLGGAAIPAKRTVEDFHAGVAWVSQIALFITLGLLVFPSQLGGVALDGVLIAAVLMFVARPLGTLVATRIGGFSLKESALVGWAGLRGALPVVFATFAVIEHVPQAERFFNIVFFVVLSSTLIQGATLDPLARALRLTTDEPPEPRSLLEVGTVRRLGAEVLEFPVSEGDAVVGRVVRELELPREALVNVVVRGEQALLPRGSTEIQAGDRLHILVRQPERAGVEALYERWREGPIGTPEPAVAPLQGRAAIFSVKPWREAWGDPGQPHAVEGSVVARTLRIRHGEAGALVQLDDGRFAVTGDGLVAAGGARQLFRYCRDRIRRAQDEQGRAWWQEVAGVLSQRVVR